LPESRRSFSVDWCPQERCLFCAAAFCELSPFRSSARPERDIWLGQSGTDATGNNRGPTSSAKGTLIARVDCVACASPSANAHLSIDHGLFTSLLVDRHRLRTGFSIPSDVGVRSRPRALVFVSCRGNRALVSRVVVEPRGGIGRRASLRALALDRPRPVRSQADRLAGRFADLAPLEPDQPTRGADNG
jgi:hypothetical protein